MLPLLCVYIFFKISQIHYYRLILIGYLVLLTLAAEVVSDIPNQEEW